jgi:hypothetical protein
VAIGLFNNDRASPFARASRPRAIHRRRV